ncbi:MAG: M28 family peptidase, partial [Gemmatimonadales bacterium]|nr:M28 family peptidase [Gemmatimonadales bacterium]
MPSVRRALPLLLSLACLAPGARAATAQVADTVRLAADLRVLAGAPALAGLPRQDTLVAHVLRELARAGWDTARTPFAARVPHPHGSYLHRLSPQPGQVPSFELRAGDDSLTFGGIWPPFAAYSPADSVEGPALYVNRGEPEDWRTLDSLRVDPGGAIAIVRTGRSSPLQVARRAAARGVKALVVFTDPLDAGYMHGETYPDGPWRHPDALTRLPLVAGPGPQADAPIPVIPIGYGHAFQLMAAQRAGPVPQAWQGALPFRYHTGMGEVRAAVVTRRDADSAARRTLVNTVATLGGRDAALAPLVVGAPRDALGPGAIEQGSGVASLLELARLLGARARDGWRPRRTIVLATWEGSAWGQLGAMAFLASGRAPFAYVELARTGGGRRFHAAGTPALGPALAAALADVRGRGAWARVPDAERA